MRVGLNLVYLVEDSGGSGTYARELIPRMLQADAELELTAWVGSTAPAWLAREAWADRVRWVRLPVPGVGTPWHMWHELVGIGVDARRRELDLVHGLAYLAPVVHPGIASVVTILDVIWMHHPEAAGRRFRLTMRTLAPLVGRTSSRVIAISEAAREDISHTLRLAPDKFDVTPLGISTRPRRSVPGAGAGVRERLGLGDEEIVLCVAAKRPHKNLHGLVRAFAQLDGAAADGRRAQLVMPGSPNAYERRLRELAEELGVAARVHFPGWISQEDLEELYAAAACFVLPTLLEGFGLPVLEAMAREVPVACSDIPVLSEVAGSAALLFDPNDPASIASALGRLISHPELAQELVRRGRERCAMFTWERTAQLTLESYRRALGDA